MKTLTLRSTLILTAAALWLAAGPAALAADPPSVLEYGWVPNAQVRAIVRTADTVYLGGNFTALGRNRPMACRWTRQAANPWRPTTR